MKDQKAIVTILVGYFNLREILFAAMLGATSYKMAYKVALLIRWH